MKINKRNILIISATLSLVCVLANHDLEASNPIVKKIHISYKINGRNPTLEEAETIFKTWTASGRKKTIPQVITEMEAALRSVTIVNAPNTAELLATAKLYELKQGNLNNLEKADILAMSELQKDGKNPVNLQEVEEQKIPVWLKALKPNATDLEREAGRAVKNFSEAFVGAIDNPKLDRIVKLHSLYPAGITEAQFACFEKVIALGTDQNAVTKDQVDAMTHLVTFKDIGGITQDDLAKAISLQRIGIMKFGNGDLVSIGRLIDAVGGLPLDAVTPHQFALSMRLQELNYQNFSQEEFRIAEHLSAHAGNIAFITRAKMEAAKKYITIAGLRLGQVNAGLGQQIAENLDYVEHLCILKPAGFDDKDLRVMTTLVTAYGESANHVDLSILNAGLALNRLRYGNYGRDKVEDVRKIHNLGIAYDHITDNQVQIMSRLRSVGYEYGQIDQRTFKLAEKIHDLGIPQFSQNHVNVALRLVDYIADIPAMTTDQLDLGFKLMDLGYHNFGPNEKNQISKIITFGTALEGVTQKQMQVIQELERITGSLGRVTDQMFAKAQRIDALGYPVSHKNIEIMDKIIGFGANLNNVSKLEMAAFKRLVDVLTSPIENIHEDDFRYSLKLGSFDEYNNYSFQDFLAFQCLLNNVRGINLGNVTKSQTDQAVRLLDISMGVSEDQFKAMTCLTQNGHQLGDINQSMVECAERLMALDLHNDFSVEKLAQVEKAAELLGDDTSKVEKNHVTAIAKLNALNLNTQDIDLPTFNAAVTMGTLGRHALTLNELSAAKALAAMGLNINNDTLPKALRLVEINHAVLTADDMTRLDHVLRINGGKLEDVQSSHIAVVGRYMSEAPGLNINDLTLESMNKAAQLVHVGINDFTANQIRYLQQLLNVGIALEDVTGDQVQVVEKIHKNGVTLRAIDKDKIDCALALLRFNVQENVYTDQNLKIMAKLVTFDNYSLENLKEDHLNAAFDLVNVHNRKIEDLSKEAIENIVAPSVEHDIIQTLIKKLKKDISNKLVQQSFGPKVTANVLTEPDLYDQQKAAQKAAQKAEKNRRFDLQKNQREQDVQTLIQHYANAYRQDVNVQNQNSFIDYIDKVLQEKEFDELDKKKEYVDQVYRLKDLIKEHHYSKAHDYFKEIWIYMEQLGIPYNDRLNKNTIDGIYLDILNAAGGQLTSAKNITFGIRVLKVLSNLSEDEETLGNMFDTRKNDWEEKSNPHFTFINDLGDEETFERNDAYHIDVTGTQIFPYNDIQPVKTQIDLLWNEKRAHGFCLNYPKLTYENVLSAPLKKSGQQTYTLDDARGIMAELQQIIAGPNDLIVERKNQIKLTFKKFLGLKENLGNYEEDNTSYYAGGWKEHNWRLRISRLWGICDKLVNASVVRPGHDNYNQDVWERALKERKKDLAVEIDFFNNGCPTGVNRNLNNLEKSYIFGLCGVDLKTPILLSLGGAIETILLDRLSEVVTFEKGPRTGGNEPAEMNATGLLILTQRLRMPLSLSGDFDPVVFASFGQSNLPCNAPDVVVRAMFRDGEPDRQYDHPMAISSPIRGKAICVKTMVDKIYDQFGQFITTAMLKDYIATNPILIEELEVYREYDQIHKGALNKDDYINEGSIFFKKGCKALEYIEDAEDPKEFFKPTLACSLLVDMGIIHMEKQLKDKLFQYEPFEFEDDGDSFESTITKTPSFGTANIPGGAHDATLENWIDSH